MRKILGSALMLTALLAGGTSASAQGMLPLAVEVRGGAGFPVGEFGEGDALNTGWGFEANAQLRVAPMLAVYAGYDVINFEFEDAGLLGTTEGSFQDQGLSAGAQLSLPTGMLLGVSPFVRAGALYHQGKYDYGNDLADVEFDRSLGYEVGGGLVFPLGMVVSFTPAVRYRSYGLKLDGNDSADDTVSYVTVDLGMKFGF